MIKTGNLWEVGNDGRMKLKSFLSDPSGSAGMVIYNDTDKKLKYHDGTSWKSTGGIALGAGVDGQPTTNSFFPKTNDTNGSGNVSFTRSMDLNIPARSSPLYRCSPAGGLTITLDAKRPVNPYYGQPIESTGQHWAFGDLAISAATTISLNQSWYSGTSVRSGSTPYLSSVLYGQLYSLSPPTNYTVELRYQLHVYAIPTLTDWSSMTPVSGTPWASLRDLNLTTGYTVTCATPPYDVSIMTKLSAFSFTGDSVRLYVAANAGEAHGGGWSPADHYLQIWNFDTNSWELIRLASNNPSGDSNANWVAECKDICIRPSTKYCNASGEVYILNSYIGADSGISSRTLTMDEVDLWGAYASPQ